MDILAEKIPARLGRYNPRVVKKPGVEFPVKEANSQGKWNSTTAAQLIHFQYRIELNNTHSFGVR